jgi:hypothetical protein
MKRIFLYKDVIKLDKVLNDESQKIRKLKEIRDIVKVAMGDAPLNYNQLIKEGINALIDAYITEFSPNFPKHLNKKNRFLADTNINLTRLESLISEYNTFNLSQPTITPEGELVSTINEKDFDVYLDENDIDFYNTVLAFRDILNKVQPQKFEHYNYYSTAIQLTRYLTFNPTNPNQAILNPKSFK